MAKVHHLFYSTDSDKQTLHRNIVPTDEQQKLQQERWNELCEYLLSALKEKTGYEMSSWLQGSYKFKTQVRPADKHGEFDIDLGLYFIWPGNNDDGKFSPQEIKSLVQESLLDFKGEDENIDVVAPAKERCSRIRFSGGFHIDVPSYHLDEAQDERTLATEKNVWEKSDPQAFYSWFQDRFSEEDSSQIRRLIRYVKIWVSLHIKDSPPTSILLTVLVSEAYLKITEQECESDDVVIKCVAEKIIERLENNMIVENPVNKEENLNRLSSQQTSIFLDNLHNLVGVADRALIANSEFEAAIIWSEAFLYFFPILDPKYVESGNMTLVSTFEPRVSVKAVSTVNSNMKYFGKNRIGPIPKKCNITFNIENTTELPEGAQASWMVRNSGQEAEFTNDLGHFAGKGQYFIEETSAYVGTHFMDLVVRSRIGEVLGYRRIPVEISGMFIPQRNVKKKHFYSKFRKK